LLVVSDTSPLRALQAIDSIGVLGRLYDGVVIPAAVATELAVDVPDLGPFPLAGHPFIEVRPASDVARVLELAATLDRGEAEAIAIAVELRAVDVLMDDASARAVAEGLGLRPVGVLALLVQAKAKGYVPAVRPLIDQLKARIRFRASAVLVSRILSDAGE
jgi:uncharacterized protein